ncbi:MAG: HD-GYP domain-containing protein [Thermogutta sp.]
MASIPEISAPEWLDVTPVQEFSGQGDGDSSHQNRGPMQISGPMNVRPFEEAFGQNFAIFDGVSGQFLGNDPELPLDWEHFGILCRVVSQRRQPEIIWEEDPLLFLAIPYLDGEEERVAIGAFVSRFVAADEDLSLQSRSLAVNQATLRAWAVRQIPWQPRALLQVAEATLNHLRQVSRARSLEKQMEEMSVHLAAVYEEISLLHRLTRDLRLSKSDEDLARTALRWLLEIIPAEGIGLILLPVAQQDGNFLGNVRTTPVLLTAGEFPFMAEAFLALAEHFQVRSAKDPVVKNYEEEPYPFAGVLLRNIIAVPVLEGENLFGYLAAVNHSGDQQFGSMEANLLHSVATIIGVHSGNIDLYRQQAELLAGVVKALTSAIDAKDPYTCGHSDRVARIAVRLAQELGYPPEILSRVYLAGLLHDIGKIGVHDAVLQKPGKLTEREFELIKTHVKTGYRILSGLKQLEDITQVVLHHHEAWNGAGYPEKLAGEAIPQIARIVAVADAYDAMASDRPYRTRMPNAKIDEIIRAGAGQQWDPTVVEAFFRARNDLRQIADEKDLRLLNHPLLGPVIRKSMGLPENGNPLGAGVADQPPDKACDPAP